MVHEGRIVSINTSEKKSVRKKPVPSAVIREEFGIEGDAHASGEWHRQVSLLALESIRKMQALGLKVGPGDFAENLTTEGIDLLKLPLGTRVAIGDSIEGEVSQIGKECHTRCAIYHQAGDCVMPKEGIFIRVRKGGDIKTGDAVRAEVDDAIKFTACVVTMSDKGSRGERSDESGPAIGKALEAIGCKVVASMVLPDERDKIVSALKQFSNQVDLILTTGGTGFSPRDVTPEATLEVIERRVPGIPEALRAAGMTKTPRAMLSRAEAGIRGRTLIVNMPGSLAAVLESLDVIIGVLPHALQKLGGDQADCGRSAHRVEGV